jgi:hypothetical protein
MQAGNRHTCLAGGVAQRTTHVAGHVNDNRRHGKRRNLDSAVPA